jgi:hypothetical protein
MSISSLSYSFVNRAAPTPASPTGVQLAPAPEPLPVAEDRHENHGGARPKALYNAMLSALRDLGMPAAPPAPTGTAASADAAPAAATTPSVKGAVFAFTSALFQALGDAGASAGGEERHSNHGRGHAYAYGRTSHAWSRDGFAGLADRLEGLAASLSGQATTATPAAPPTPPVADPSAPTAPAAPTASSATTAPTASPALPASTAPSAQAAAAAPATGPAADTPATGSTTPVTASTAQAPETAPIAATGSNPLVSAFNSLLQALHVPVAEESSGSGDVTARLASFLHSLAQALRPTSSEPVAPAQGMLLNETA